VELRELIAQALAVRAGYEQLEQQRYGRHWTNDEIALGFVGDVGDLAKLVIAQNGVRAIPDTQNKLAHELCDCLWAVIVLAHQYDIDLERAFPENMAWLSAQIEQQLRSGSDG
jgi:NTP pyrophosphatase (non-canonical NTP hydrolase)